MARFLLAIERRGSCGGGTVQSSNWGACAGCCGGGVNITGDRERCRVVSSCAARGRGERGREWEEREREEEDKSAGRDGSRVGSPWSARRPFLGIVMLFLPRSRSSSVRAPARTDPDPAVGYPPKSASAAPLRLACPAHRRPPHRISLHSLRPAANVLNAFEHGSLSFQSESYTSRTAGHPEFRTSPSSSKTPSNRARSYHRLSREDLSESA